MIRARTYRLFSVVVGITLSGLLAIVAVSCSDNAEGERCEPANNSADCESPLVCTLDSQLRPEFRTISRCCPPNRANATVPACMPIDNNSVGNTEPDAASPGFPVPDAQTDAPADAAVEAAPDASGDAADAADGD